MRYLIEGRIIPERVDLNIPKIGIRSSRSSGGDDINISITIIRSKIFIYILNDIELSDNDIRNIASSILYDLINYIGFQAVLCYSFELESITDTKSERTFVFGIDGQVFSDIAAGGGCFSFKVAENGKISLNAEMLQNRFLSRATMELRNAIRYHDYTALHCRLAIEAIRNAFDNQDEDRGWRELRSRLKVRRETIESFKDVSDAQRHGRNIPQSWAQRQASMQIAWEIVHRYDKMMREKLEYLDVSEF